MKEETYYISLCFGGKMMPHNNKLRCIYIKLVI